MKFVMSVLVLGAIVVFIWTCNAIMEPFTDMRPWFGYEPGMYGPGWGRTGCSKDKPCTTVS
jgi:hypothetical protein